MTKDLGVCFCVSVGVNAICRTHWKLRFFFFAVQHLKFTLPCLQLECNFHTNLRARLCVCVCLFLFAINPCVSAARTHFFNMNNHKIKTLFVWKNKHFYNKEKNGGNRYLSINLPMQSLFRVCYYCFTEFVLVVFCFYFISLNTIFTLRRSSWLVCFFLLFVVFSLLIS